jgi:pyruvate dehydrogenase E1 component
MSSFISAGTAYANVGVNMIPFFVYYSMFGFQRVGDFIWQGADARARGFLLGATAGRTTLNGEGLQHQDGHSLLMALTNPAVKAWDPAFAYELSYIIQHGIQEMWGEDKDVIYYISLYNENHPMPALPEDPKFKDGLLKGLYKFKAAEKKKHTVRILASGSVMQEALKAIDLLAEYDVGCEIWSVTNYGELNREAVAAERYSRLHPQEKPRSCWVKECLNDYDGVTIAVSDNMSAVPEMLKNHVNCQMTVLGTDGFGRSDTREALRSFFEIDSFSVTVAALSGLSRKGQIKPDVVLKAMEKFGVKTERTDITV